MNPHVNVFGLAAICQNAYPYPLLIGFVYKMAYVSVTAFDAWYNYGRLGRDKINIDFYKRNLTDSTHKNGGAKCPAITAHFLFTRHLSFLSFDHFLNHIPAH